MITQINNIEIWLLVYIFVIGLCIGSFLNVVILRGLADESIVFPPSKCPKCLNKLKWYHNIPIFSYVFLRGKCAFCHEKISIQYPIIEFLNGLIYGALFLKYGLCLNLLFYFIFASLFIVIFMTDIKEKVIFTRHTYILTLFGLLYNFLNKNLIDSVLGGLVGFIFLEIFFIFFREKFSIYIARKNFTSNILIYLPYFSLPVPDILRCRHHRNCNLCD